MNVSVQRIHSSERHCASPWLFFILVQPLGIYIGFVTTVLSFLLSKQLVPVDRIAQVTSLISLAWVFGFLWAPVVDTTLRRRTWLFIAALITALCLAVSISIATRDRLLILTLVGFLGAGASSLIFSSCGGLMITSFSRPQQGKASAWYEAGKLGASAIGAALLLKVAQQHSTLNMALIAFLMVLSPALIAFTLAELPPRPTERFRVRIMALGKELHDTVRAQKHVLSLLLMISPIGTGAASALLPAIAAQYGVGAEGVIWVNGVGGGLVLALGSLSGTLIPGHWDRRLSYVLAGVCNGLAAIVLLSAQSSGVYVAGTILYLATTGLCWARYAALLIETVGSKGLDLSSRYSVLGTVGNIPLAYMVWLDGIGFKMFGYRGLFWVDAGGNLLVFVIFSFLFALNERRNCAPVPKYTLL